MTRVGPFTITLRTNQLILLRSEYWRKRSHQTWLLKEDANTTYFHAIANGWRRKCDISRPVTYQWIITDPTCLIIGTYIHVLSESHGSGRGSRGLSLSQNIWHMLGPVLEEENNILMLSFTAGNWTSFFSSMKVDTAPGPDGLPIIFFKKFWSYSYSEWFALGRVNISRLNFEFLSLIPKV